MTSVKRDSANNAQPVLGVQNYALHFLKSYMTQSECTYWQRNASDSLKS